MTCIVGIVTSDGRVILGADSAGVGGLDLRIRRDAKAFTNGELIIGGTTSFRMLQLLQFDLSPPPIVEGREPYAYAVRDLVPAIRTTLKNGGWMQSTNGRDEGGCFMVGFRGRLFTIHSDFQVAEATQSYEAVGCGADYAMGAMFARSDADPMTRLQAGLNAAAKFSAGVAGPFSFVELPSYEAAGKRGVIS